MTPESLQNINTVNINDKTNISNVIDINVGPECECLLATLPLEYACEIRSKCLEFYITAVREMLKRLPYNDNLFQQLIFLDPKIALYDEGRLKVRDLTFIATRIGNIDVTKLAYEWRILPSFYNNLQKDELAQLEIDIMWHKILESVDFNNDKVFPNLELLVRAVLSFPHSNAEAERIFSIVTDVKNKKRNRLLNETISAICVTRSSFQAKDINCINFEILPDHLKLHNSRNLYESDASDGF